MIRLSVGEWHLVTRLSYGEDDVLKKQKTAYRPLNMYFDGLFRNINLTQFNSRFKELDFKVIYDIDALKIALYYFINRALNERKDHC